MICLFVRYVELRLGVKVGLPHYEKIKGHSRIFRRMSGGKEVKVITG
jgi:hypothetical protein